MPADRNRHHGQQRAPWRRRRGGNASGRAGAGQCPVCADRTATAIAAVQSCLIGAAMPSLDINGKRFDIEAEADTPLLWVLRGELKLTGTKFGCGIAQCGACTIHLNGVAVRACVTPVSAAIGQAITTIEALAGRE